VFRQPNFHNECPYERGLVLYRQGRYVDAEQQFRSALPQNRAMRQLTVSLLCALAVEGISAERRRRLCRLSNSRRIYHLRTT